MEKNIKVEEDVWKKLQQEKLEEGYNKISELVRTKINFVEKFANEKDFIEWFKNNYELLGFSKILEHTKQRFPDFKMELDGKEVEIELETSSSNFIRHNHDPKKVDIVICLVNDKTLPVRTIEITSFEYFKKFSSIRISPKIWAEFRVYCIENKTTTQKKLEELIIKEMNKKC